MCERCIFYNNGKCPAMKDGICHLFYKENGEEHKDEE